MKAIHIMPDGSKRASVAGAVIQNDEFYSILKQLLREKAE